jgi:hypothetical protein
MSDHFNIGPEAVEAVPVPADPSKPRTILNARGSGTLYFKNVPTFEPPEGTKLAPGESTKVTERVWLKSDADVAVIVEP